MKEDIDQDFTVDYSCKLGSGAFGDVFRGMWKSRNCFVAVKRIKEFIGNAKEMIDDEIKVMNNLQHDNVLAILKVAKINSGTFLIIQYCQGGSLEKQINKGIPEINCLKFLKQIVDGMAAVNLALHIHRDLKPENILFTKENILKICDFGLARRIMGDDPNQIEKFSAKGTPLFSSPQILRHQKYSGKCDVWSAGVILVEMLTKQNPFHKAKNMPSLVNLQEKLKEKGHYVLEGNINPWFKNVVAKMMAFEENDRWSFFELQQHINNDYEKVLKSLGQFDAIQTTTRQNGKEGETTIYTKPAQNLQQKIHVLKGKKPPTTQEKKPINGGNISRQEEKLLTRQQNKKLLTALKSYVQFLYNRGKLFADIGTKYFQAKEINKTNGYKFMVLFLAISVFIKSIEKIFNIISKQTEILMPDGVKIKFSALDEASVKDFQAVKKDYQNQMQLEIDKFLATIMQIQSKMTSDKYKKEYPGLMNDHSDLIRDLINMKNNQSAEKLEYYEENFRKFFKKECVEKNPQGLNEAYLRIYFVCLKLVNVEETIPLSRYKDNYIINQIIDDSSKLTIDQIKQEVKKLSQKLMI